MLIERIHELAGHATRGVDEVPAHKAVVELLVLVVYADERISTDELEALERFDDEHADWDAGPFSVQQYLPVAVAKVRNALDDPGSVDALITDAAERITDPSIRATAIEACNSLAAIGGIDPADSEMLRKIVAQLQ